MNPSWLPEGLASALVATQWAFLCYFICINVVYLALNFIAMFAILRYAREHGASFRIKNFADYQPPVSILPRCHLVATPATRMAPRQFPLRLHANSSTSSSPLGQTLPSWTQHQEPNKHPLQLPARHQASIHQGIQPDKLQVATPDTSKESHKPDLPEAAHQREKMALSPKPHRSQAPS